MLDANIRFLRKQDNLSQEDFAERFGVSRQSVAKWEGGESLPDLMKCREIAQFYDILIDTLVSVPLDGSTVKEKEGKYIFGIVKVGKDGEIMLPEYAREVFRLKPGDRMMVMGDTAKGGIALAKVQLGDLFGKK